jgi:eukaryotic-like serine/threonine-protein kinase
VLARGTSFGKYQVLEPIGAGGMGRVFRARDTRLGRDVALKVLSEPFKLDPEQRVSLEREARVLASLNHPNIATLHGIEESGETQALVLELVDGPTLAERIADGPLGLEEVLAIALQIAVALEAAHENGVVHRDLKPQNVKLRADGNVKLLDFGLAKVFAPAADAGPKTATVTAAGAPVGTPAYMSPEQSRGAAVDKRTDIWAFGCLLYEMLAGQPAFAGEHASDVVAAIITREPDFGMLPPGTPPALLRLLRRCLEKDPRRRLRDIGDARLELADVTAADGAGAGRYQGPRRATAWGLAVLGLLVVAVGAALVARERLGTRPVAPPVEMAVALPRGVSITAEPGFDWASAIALSPDGRTLVIAGTDEQGEHRLYARPLGRLEVTEIAGTAGGSAPFFSPDGAWLAFFADGRLKRVPAEGGAAVDITAAPGFPAGASWSADGRIAFVFGARSTVHVVDARGGAAEPLTRLEDGEGGHYRPEFSPDGRMLLFDTGARVHVLELKSGRRVALTEGTRARHLTDGQLILSRGRDLLIAPFDGRRLEITGPVKPLDLSVGSGNASEGVSHYAAAAGTLAFVPGVAAHELVLRGPDGAERLLAERRAMFENPQFSPDGRRLAVATRRRPGDAAEIWIHDLETGTASRLTFDGGHSPVWTPDGTAVTYSHLRARSGIFRMAADGRGAPEQLVAVAEFHWLVGWTPDGRTLAYGQMERPADDGISRSSIVALAGGEPRFVVGPGPIWGGRLSPDGRWLVYFTPERGRYEIRLVPFPDGGAQYLIVDGGTAPAWAPDGSEIYYRSGSQLWAVAVEAGTKVQVGIRRLVIDRFTPPAQDDYHVHPDGRSLVYVRPVDAAGGEVRMILNGLAALQRGAR